MHRTRLIAGAAIGASAALAIAAMASTTASAAPRDTATGVVTSPTATAQSTSAALSYWTPARMKAAKPLGIVIGSKAPAAKPTAAQLAPSTTSGSVAGATATGLGAPVLPSSVAAVSAAAPVPAAFSYPFPFVRYPVYPLSLTTTYPGSVNGKLFFTQNGGGFVCSATSVVAPSRVRVWTAGHCVSDGHGHFDSNAVFVPAYNNGSAPFGTFPATSFTTSTDWHNTGDFARDLGAFRVGNNSSGQNLVNRVGSAGFTWGQNRDQQFRTDAYPAAAPFNGAIQWENLMATATAVNVGTGPAATGAGSDFTGGSSGGSWRIQSGGAFVGYIDGHNDFKFSSQPNAMYTPYFDTLANAVRCAGESTGNACP